MDQVMSKIRKAFQAGELRVRSVGPTGEVFLAVVTDVLRHDSLGKACVRVTTESGKEVVATEDHSLFSMESGFPVATKSNLLEEGEPIAVVGTCLEPEEIQKVETALSRPFMYDLSVPGPENFVLSNGIVAHNSYSIGGVSLDIEKSSKYESLKQGASEQFTTMLEKAKSTVKVIKGLQQPRYGMGIRSSFGPLAGRGILTPSKFMGM
jgi:hypothetical protein